MVWLGDNFIYRKRITISAPEDIPAGHFIEFQLPPSTEAQGKVRSDYQDIEVVRDSDNTAMNRTVVAESDGSLSITFATDIEIVDGDTSFYVYYGDLNLQDTPARDATPIVSYPVTYTPNDGSVSYQRPGEDWIDGASTVALSRCSLTGYFDDIRVSFVSGSDRGIAEVKLLGEDNWSAVDTFAINTGTVDYDLTTNSSELQHLQIRNSGSNNLSSSGVKVELSSIGVSLPHTAVLDFEEINLDAL